MEYLSGQEAVDGLRNTKLKKKRRQAGRLIRVTPGFAV
jgi:hypothetical protein